jgi:hypothetical protein
MVKRSLRNGLILIALLWDTGWKLAAARRAIGRRQFKWIAPLLFVNSLGILPILYLQLFGKERPANST